MSRAYYSNSISNFLLEAPNQILGVLTQAHNFTLLNTQRDAWLEQTIQLQQWLSASTGDIYFEFSIPRMGKRVDVLLVIGSAIFVVEFKVGASQYLRADLDQVIDYALDLSNFHEGSHDAFIIPVLISTEVMQTALGGISEPEDKIFVPILTNGTNLREIIQSVLSMLPNELINSSTWEQSGYKPTPTIIEATLALYNGHSVVDISRNDAGATNLSQTSLTVASIIERSRRNNEKAIVFVTGVPGAGKTLVGLDVATRHIDPDDELYSVYLSGNGPLVSILQEALARDKVSRGSEKGEPIRIGKARSEVKAFIQNVHHFRDDGLASDAAPVEHVALFDEAQRAWDKAQTVSFMKQKKNQPDFDQSEPEFLISCMDRHDDWSVVVCLIGGGQEINKGEAGIFGWADAIEESFPNWKVYASDQLQDSEYGGDKTIEKLADIGCTDFLPELHLKTSMRSFRSEKVSQFVKEVLDLDSKQARETLQEINEKYPIVLSRNINTAREWLRKKARGSERYGIVVSSQAERLRPLGVHVKAPIDPVHWFLDGKQDVRSSYYLEEVATEFHVQGLELDWACVIWDADFRNKVDAWQNWSFRGSKWQRIKKAERQIYQKNAYRVLLTRARQGMVIVVPEGNIDDATRPPEYYDGTYEYLKNIGLEVL
jgi:hypothetical protein